MEIKELLQKGFWTLLARSLGAGLMFLMTILFARWLGASDFGLFSLGLTIMTIFSIIARWGTDQVLLKQVGAHWETEPEIAKGYIVSVIKLVAIISIALTFIVTTLNEAIANYIFNKPEFSEVLFWFGLMIVPFAINYTIAEAYKGTGKPVLSSYLQNVITPFVAIVIVGILYFSSHSTLITISQSFALGIIISLLISISLWKRIHHQTLKTSIAIKQIIKEGWPMLLITSGSLIITWSDILIIGLWGTPEEIGIYSAATKTVMITSLILIAMNSITAPKYAFLYKKGDLKGLKQLAKNSSKILLLLVLFPTAFLLFYSESIMSWFGNEFIIGSTVLMILTIGQFLNVVAGSVGYLLTMTGHEQVMQNIMFKTAMLNIVLSVILMHIYGSIGVAIATSVSFAIWNFWALYTVRRKLNFWAIYFPLNLQHLAKEI